MLKAPKVPWPYRLAALGVALLIAAFWFQLYVAGRKFAGAITNYARLAAEQSKPAPKPPEFANEPGVVPVTIIKTEKKNPSP